MSERYKSLFTSKWAFLAYGVLAAAIIILGIRFITYNPPHETHYHANFAVFLNGKQETFKDPKYYEEVNLCSLHGATPAARTHMHDETPGVIHVHDDAVTWGQFFENLGWQVGPAFVYDSSKLYTDDDTNKLHIILNGQNLTGITNITNEVIHDKDRLLVSYGSEDSSALDTEFKSVPNNAAKYDSTPDPASCQGAEKVTAADRLKHLF